MKSATAVGALGIAMLLAPFHLPAQMPDPSADGWVAHADGARLEICYGAAALPTTGASVQLLREHDEPLNNKGVERRSFVAIGHARILSGGKPSCVLASLLDGKAGRGDLARLRDPAF